MTESITYPNPLRMLHEKAESEFQPYFSIDVVSTFGEPQAEYAAIRKAAALLDQPQRGILELGGPDRHAFLNNLITNQVWDKASKTAIAPGNGVYAFLINTKGRIQTDLNVIERDDRTWLDMDVRKIDVIKKDLDRFIFREKVTLASKVGALHTLAIHGPQALGIVAECCEPKPPALAAHGSFATRMFSAPAVIWRDDVCSTSGVQIVLETADVEQVWNALLARFHENQAHGRRRLRPAGWAAFNAARIEGGRPIFGIDFDETMLPAETGQTDRAVNFNKGCYLGQEIVARMQSRGQVARQIVGLRVDDDALPLAGSMLYDDADNEVGGITSSTISPLLSNACIALALAKKAFIPVGNVVKVPAEGSMRPATVVALPFVKPQD